MHQPLKNAVIGIAPDGVILQIMAAVNIVLAFGIVQVIMEIHVLAINVQHGPKAAQQEKMNIVLAAGIARRGALIHANHGNV